MPKRKRKLKKSSTSSGNDVCNPKRICIDDKGETAHSDIEHETQQEKDTEEFRENSAHATRFFVHKTNEDVLLQKGNKIEILTDISHDITDNNTAKIIPGKELPHNKSDFLSIPIENADQHNQVSQSQLIQEDSVTQKTRKFLKGKGHSKTSAATKRKIDRERRRSQRLQQREVTIDLQKRAKESDHIVRQVAERELISDKISDDSVRCVQQDKESELIGHSISGDIAMSVQTQNELISNKISDGILGCAQQHKETELISDNISGDTGMFIQTESELVSDHLYDDTVSCMQQLKESEVIIDNICDDTVRCVQQNIESESVCDNISGDTVISVQTGSELISASIYDDTVSCVPTEQDYVFQQNAESVMCVQTESELVSDNIDDDTVRFAQKHKENELISDNISGDTVMCVQTGSELISASIYDDTVSCVPTEQDYVFQQNAESVMCVQTESELVSDNIHDDTVRFAQKHKENELISDNISGDTVMCVSENLYDDTVSCMQQLKKSEVIIDNMSDDTVTCVQQNIDGESIGDNISGDTVMCIQTEGCHVFQQITDRYHGFQENTENSLNYKKQRRNRKGRKPFTAAKRKKDKERKRQQRLKQKSANTVTDLGVNCAKRKGLAWAQGDQIFIRKQESENFNLPESDNDCDYENCDLLDDNSVDETTVEEREAVRLRMANALAEYYAKQYPSQCSKESLRVAPEDRSELANAYDDLQRDFSVTGYTEKNYGNSYGIKDTRFTRKAGQNITAFSSNDAIRIRKRVYQKHRYNTDPEYRARRKLDDRKRYRESSQYRKKKLFNMSQKYKNDIEYKQILKTASRLKYRHNCHHRHQLKIVGIYRYRTNLLYRLKLKNASVRKYKFNIEHRQKVKGASIYKYKTNTQHNAKVKTASIDKYRTNTQHKAKVKTASIDKYRTNTQHKTKVKDASIRKYRCNFEHRKHIKAHGKCKYRHSVMYRTQEKRRLHNAYKTDATIRCKKIHTVKKRRQQKKTTDDIAKLFRQMVREGPRYICCVCHKFKFRKQVVICNVNTYARKGRQAQVMANRCISYKYSLQCTDDCNDNCEILNHGKILICYTCHRHLLKGEMPSDAAANNLALLPIPDTLQNLNCLERQLLSLRIPFMKVIRLPKGGQRGMVGPCVSVPTDIERTIKVLPRSQDESQLVRVKLKRKLPYKGHYQYEYVSSAKLKKGLQFLQENNKFYSDISFDNSWQTPIAETSNIVSESSDNLQQLTPVSNEGITDSPNYDENHDITSNTSDSHLKKDNIDDDDDDDPTGHLKALPFDTCLQPVDIGQEILDQYFDAIFCVAPGEGSTPVSMLREDGNEAMSFPVQFPQGSGTYNDNRPTRISRTRYFHSRLLNADNRFASDTQYVFYAQYLAELEQVISQVSIALRKGTTTDQTGKPISASMLTDGTNLKNLLKTDQGYKFMTPIRGTPPYWQSTLKDLFAMIRQLGIPTWFCTFSAADMRWKEVLQILMEQHGDTRSVDDLDWMQKCEILQKSCIMNSVAFDHRFHTLLKSVIIDKDVLGKVADHFHRIEFQQRGSPHSHCLFWIEDAPLLDKDDDSEVCAFVNKYVSCSLPTEQDDPELYEIVNSVQQHSKGHSKSCRKKGTICRFHFPRPPSQRTFISRPQSLTDPSISDLAPEQMMNNAKQTLNTLWEVINNSDLQEITTQNLFAAAGITQEQFEDATNILTKRTSVVLERRPSDSWINQYNPTLLRCWNANMDIQYVTDAYSCVVYIISYISKAEREMGLVLEDAKKEAADGNLDAQQAMKKIGSAYFHQREVSAQEAAYRVCGLHLKQCSRKVQFVPVGNDQLRMSKPLNLIRNKSNELDDKDIWMPTISDRYRARPPNKLFESICLASFCSEYRILATSQVPADLSKTPLVYRLQNDLGFIRKRSRTEAAVVRYPRFSQKKDSELFHKSLLQLFLPHRTDQQLKPNGFNTFEEFYNTGALKLTPSSQVTSVKSIVDANRQRFEINAEALDEAEELIHKLGPLEDAWAMIGPESELNRLECDMQRDKPNADADEQRLAIPDLDNVNKSETTDQHIEMSNTIFTAEEAVPLLRSLNRKQKQVFYSVRKWCLDKVNGKNPEPFRLFISGGAGTGKSHLIKCLYYEAHKILSPAASNPDDTVVLLTAPTGTAAFNINGTTLHRAFKLPQYMSLSYTHLRDESINTLRCQLQSLQILIIDEISMVGQEVLLYVHERLRQIMQSGNALFGNICIIAVGDFYQLPPVKQKRLYDLRPKNFFSLWSLNFCLIELDEVMRQRGDKLFAELLNRLRTRQKEDPLDANDFSCLENCQNTVCDQEALHIFATNAEVENHNRDIIGKVCASYQSVFAQDYDKDPTTGKLTPKQNPYSTCGDYLPSELLLGKGARVMLIRNVDITDGLVNGVVGTVQGIIPPLPGSSTPCGISVVFDNTKIGLKQRQKLSASPNDSTVVIKPVEEILNNNAVRHQFPLKLAWACTVHKVQGITTDKLVVSFKKIFAPGMAYVALSRVTSIEGLTIQDFDASKIYCTSLISESLKQMTPFLQEPENQDSNPHSINILLHNIQGLVPHICDLSANTDVLNYNFICITETWMEENTVKPSLSNFELYHVPRSSSYCSSASQMFSKLKQQKNGGVGVFKKHDAYFKQLHLQFPNIEAIAFQTNNKDTQATIVTIYRPATYKPSVFIQNLQKLIKQLPDDSPTLIIGDFNQDLLKSKSSINNFMKKQGYRQLVDKATTDAETLIDHVYLKGNLTIDLKIVPTYYSHHNMISLNVKLL